MAQFKSFAPNVEVKGGVVLSFVEGLGAFRTMAYNILAQYGIANPVEEQWYPQQAYLDAVKAISEKVGKTTLKQIGKHIPELAAWPPDVDTVDKALNSIDVAYHMNHRGGDIGYYRFEKTGVNSGKVICHNPYACGFDHGLIEATARKFAPAGVAVTVRHDDSTTCRQNGADTCTYTVKW